MAGRNFGSSGGGSQSNIFPNGLPNILVEN
jgi:hypothetical protein